MQELAVSAGNTGVMTSVDYQALASEVDSRMDELLNLQNTRNSSGQYIFAGYQGGTTPFSNDGGGNFTYHGDQGQLRLQASASVTVAVGDSGQRLFVDVPSGHNTFTTAANPANRALPAATISVGSVVNQEIYDELFPENLVITFNDPGEAAVPPAANFTIRESGSGKILVANQLHVPGQPIEVAGIQFHIDGVPNPPVAAVLPFNFTGGGLDYGTTPSSITLTVGTQRETFVLDQDLTGAADASGLAAILNDVGNGNAEKLARLGLTATGAGIVSRSGQSVTLGNGSPDIDALTGLTTQGVGARSTEGIPGDKFFVKSTDKQGILTTLSRFTEAMRNVKDTPVSKAEMAEVVAKTLTNLQNFITRISTVQGEVGARLNTLDSASEMNLDTELFSRKVLSQLEDLDLAEASIRLKMEEMVLGAAQQSFIKVSQMTLFNFL
jgi:flagellar hook-associated protein 3 FlgL